MNNIIPFEIITPNNQIDISHFDLFSYIEDSNGNKFVVEFTPNTFFKDINFVNKYYIDLNPYVINLQTGNYKLFIYGLKFILDSFIIDIISDDRYEAKLRIAPINSLSVINEESYYKNKYIINTQNGFYKIINSYADNEFLYVKFYEKINDDDIIGDIAQLQEELFEPIQIDFSLTESENIQKLKDLDFLSGSYSQYNNEPSFGEYNYEQLISTGNFSQSIVMDFVKDSKYRQLNIDYSKFENHVYFASAEFVFNNIYNKIIEFINLESEKLNVTGSNLTSLYSLYNHKQNEIIKELSPYEYYIFSEGWPKYNNNFTGGFYHYTSSNVSTWYNNNLESASLYDSENDAQLWLKIPNYYYDEDKNNNFYNFINSTACNYDFIKNYIDEFINFININYDGFNMPPDNILWILSNYLGFDLKDGNSFKTLTQYLLGYDITGSYNVNPVKNVTYDIWKRILNNLPYIYKSKGTKESVRSILNTYGIPAGLIDINEYTISNKYESSSYEKTYAPVRSTKYLETNGNITLAGLSNWIGSGSDTKGNRTIEFFVKTNRSNLPSGNNEYYLISGSGISITVSPSSQSNAIYGINLYGSKGKIGTTVSASIGNNKFTYIAAGLKKHYAPNPLISESFLKVIQYDNNILTFNTGFYLVSCTSPLSESTAIKFNVSTDTNKMISKSFMELRLWNRLLTENEMLKHAYDFKSVALDSVFDQATNYYNYNDLILRYKMDDNIDLGSTDLTNSAINANTSISTTRSSWPTYTQTSSLSYWKPFILNTKTFVPSPIGKRKDNKIRIISGSIESASMTYDLPIVDILWSPTNVIDNDIIENLGNLDFNEIMGNPNDYFSGSYTGINKYINAYFNKFVGSYNFNRFIKLIQNLDQSIKNSIEQTIPARSKLNYGLHIGSHIFERNKHKFENINASLLNNQSSSINVIDYYQIKCVYPSNLWINIRMDNLISVYSQSKAIQMFFDRGIITSSGVKKASDYNYAYKDMRYGFYKGCNNTELDGIINSPWTSSITYGEVIIVK